MGVVLSYGLANLGDFTRNGRMTATANDLHAAFHLARSESARAKSNITICASADGAQCGGTWDQGYIIFVDIDGDIVFDGAPENILRRQGPVEDGVTLTFANNANFFGYSANGLGRGNIGANTAVSQVVMCDERGNITGAGGNSAARLFVVTPLGRGTILRDKGQIQTAIDNIGAACP